MGSDLFVISLIHSFAALFLLLVERIIEVTGGFFTRTAAFWIDSRTDVAAGTAGGMQRVKKRAR